MEIPVVVFQPFCRHEYKLTNGRTGCTQVFSSICTILAKAWSIANEVVLGKHCKAKTIKHYISLYDRVVPTIYQLKLWKALGRPSRLDLECAHYSSFFHGKAVLKNIANTVREHAL